ncbi:DUF5017 domain-containing protein [Arcicella sp. DC2W]|uniref:DUF5017 domain-containing protein n=1 Tax=Arcicella gelida TaxID=2984195 RepID=A0ABU5S2Z1_9BACT|nr:DUF5017 domain-containing protein [Arcicella sp. DC2W]MEA5402761.1 DUF5017 domain-containing protein [Arcicella sp. DC2W]
MRKYYSLLLLILPMLLVGCNTVEFVEPTFDVSTEATTFKVGQNVTFTFSGTPDNITFYSGELGKYYTYRQRTKADSATNLLSFNTLCTATGQANNLSVLVSTDFSGTIDSNSIKKATWTDITSKAKLATNTTSTPSGNIDLSNFHSVKDTLYVAFRYKSSASTSASRARSWTISNFSMRNVFPNTFTYSHNTSTSDIRLAGIQTTSIKSDTLKWTLTGSLSFVQGLVDYAPGGDDDWAITKPFNLSKISPDMGVAVKNTSQLINSYTYQFTKAGTYKVTFVGSNSSPENYAEVVREITIQVVP